MADNAIARIADAPSAVAVNRTEFAVMREQAADLIASGYLPKAIDKPEKAVAIIMLGRELGMGPWQSFNSIDVIQGRPTLKPIGMAALVNRFVEQRGGYLRVVESTDQRCVVEYLRPPAPSARQVSFTRQEATTAGLMGKDTWKQYTQDMLRSRAISRACREGFSDVILGLYTDEEIETIGGTVRSSPAPTSNVRPFQSEPSPEDGMFREITNADAQAEEVAATIAPAPPREQTDDRQKANARYHAIGQSHGWTDAALHLLAVSHFPERPNGKTTSRQQLSGQELHDLGTLMEEIGRIVDPEGEIVPTPEVEYANAIAKANDQRMLAEIAAALKEGGIAAAWLRRMYAHRRDELPAATLIDAEPAKHGAAGSDRYTS